MQKEQELSQVDGTMQEVKDHQKLVEEKSHQLADLKKQELAKEKSSVPPTSTKVSGQPSEKTDSSRNEIKEYRIRTIGHPMLHEQHSPTNPPQDCLPECFVTLAAIAPILAAGGFASNQLGYDSVRAVIIRMDTGKYQIFNNPQFEPIEADGQDIKRESCFSIPEFSAAVKRWKSIKLQWMTEFGEVKSGTMTGAEARIMQHEIDHLDGILINDRAPMFGGSKIKKIRRQFKKLGYAYTVTELGELKR